MELCPKPYFIFTIAVKTKQKGLAGNKAIPLFPIVIKSAEVKCFANIKD